MNSLVTVLLFCSIIVGHVYCWGEIDYDKDGDLSLEDLVRKYGNVGISTYEITLSDGYIVTIHRLKREGAEKLKPILFLHGLSACIDSFFIDKKGSIPFLLAGLDYDIWFLNSRGTIYSRKHKTLNSTRDTEYWQFSWEQIGLFDVPAAIDFALKNNDNDKVALIGHSEGSYLIFVALAEHPELNEKTAISFHWGGTAYHSGCEHYMVNIGCKYRNFIEDMLNEMGIYQLIPTLEARKTIISLCRMDVFNNVCKEVLFEVLFVSENTFDSFKDISYIFSRWLCGGSAKEFTHFLQIGKSGRFAKYDFGSEKNKEIYNSTIPPRFHLEQITSPTAIFCGTADIYCKLKDIEKAKSEIPNVVYSTPIEGLGHIDFIINKRFKRYIQKEMFMLLQKYHPTDRLNLYLNN